MAPRAENGTAAGSVNGEHAVPNKGQSFVFKIPRNLSLIAKRSFLIVCSGLPTNQQCYLCTYRSFLA